MNDRLAQFGLVLALALLGAGHSRAATINAASPSRADVSTAVTAASNGDTILIPDGFATWTNTLTVTKWLTFQGAGIDQTILTMAIPGSSASLPGLLLQGNGYNQVTGITFNGSNMLANPAVTIWSGSACRIYECKFIDCEKGAYIWGPFGVLDHNEFVNCHLSVRVYGVVFGCYNWDTYYPIAFDSTNYLFLEDNTFSLNSSIPTAKGTVHAFISSGQGSSLVARNNLFSWNYHAISPIVDWHGDNGDGTRGSLSVQFYSNVVSCVAPGALYVSGDARGGQSLLYSNVWTGLKASFRSREEHPTGTTACSETVYDYVTNMFAWANTAGVVIAAGTGAEYTTYSNAAPETLLQPDYPHPLVSSPPDPPTEPGALRFYRASRNNYESDGSATTEVIRENGTDGTVTVDYATANGTALAGVQYTTTTGTLTWTNGDSAYKYIDVPVADLDATNSTYYNIVLSNPTGGASLGSISTQQVTLLPTGEIVPPVPGTLQIATPTFTAEPGASITNYFSREGGTDGEVALGFATANGIAIAGTDYTATNGTVTWPNGDGATKSVTITLLDTGEASATDRVFTIVASNPTGGATLGASDTATVTITMPAIPTVQFSAPAFVCYDSQASVSVGLTRSETGVASTVDYTTSNGTALAGTDYTAASGTAEFAVGESEATVSVPILTRVGWQGSRDFLLTLSSSTNSVLGALDSIAVSILDSAVARRGIATGTARVGTLSQ